MAYAGVNTTTFKPGLREAAAKVVDAELIPFLQQQPGFISYQSIVVGPDTTVGIVTWQTQEHQAQSESALAQFPAWEQRLVPTIASSSVQEGPVRISIRGR